MPQQGAGVADCSRRGRAARPRRRADPHGTDRCRPHRSRSRRGVGSRRDVVPAEPACRRISIRSRSVTSAHALLLEPQGKLVVDLRAAHVADDEWWCVCEAGFGAVLAAGPEPLQDPGEGRDRGPLGRRRRARGARARRDDVHGDRGRARRDRSWCASTGRDMPGVELLGVAECDRRAVARARRARAWPRSTPRRTRRCASKPACPRQGFDIDETTIAQEAFLERDAVSFTKGCFLGQELVCRIDSRGHVNRLLRRLRADVAARARCRGGRRRQGGRHGHERGRHGRAGDAAARGRARQRRCVVRRRRATCPRRGRRRLTSDPRGSARRDRERHDEAGAARRAVPRPRRVPPIAAASSRTIARPRPVPTDRPGVSRAV